MQKKQKQKKSKNGWVLPAVVAVLLVVALAATAGYLLWERGPELSLPEPEPSVSPENTLQPEPSPESGYLPEPTEPVETLEPENSLPIDMGWGLVLTDVSSYAGLYLEDGSDELVSGVMMLRIKNMGSELIQLADITAIDGEGSSYSFRLTTLLPGKEMTVMESSRAEYTAGVEIIEASVDNVALFSETPSMYEETLSFECSDYTIKVKNISDSEFPGGRVFYKSVSGELYIGGITYTVGIPALAPGEEAVLSARHFYDKASELMFVTYAG